MVRRRCSRNPASPAYCSEIATMRASRSASGRKAHRTSGSQYHAVTVLGVKVRCPAISLIASSMTGSRSLNAGFEAVTRCRPVARVVPRAPPVIRPPAPRDVPDSPAPPVRLGWVGAPRRAGAGVVVGRRATDDPACGVAGVEAVPAGVAGGTVGRAVGRATGCAPVGPGAWRARGARWPVGCGEAAGAAAVRLGKRPRNGESRLPLGWPGAWPGRAAGALTWG